MGLTLFPIRSAPTQLRQPVYSGLLDRGFLLDKSQWARRQLGTSGFWVIAMNSRGHRALMPWEPVSPRLEMTRFRSTAFDMTVISVYISYSTGWAEIWRFILQRTPGFGQPYLKVRHPSTCKRLERAQGFNRWRRPSHCTVSTLVNDA